ncbi:hypothetical protein AJ88_24650 [Mesorhizobium amorphae CCBAU 01583]|nr:hypothetical protein AJ88_24650 [Mesorhizobium amorphae CCBAU 01583]
MRSLSIGSDDVEDSLLHKGNVAGWHVQGEAMSMAGGQKLLSTPQSSYKIHYLKDFLWGHERGIFGNGAYF